MSLNISPRKPTETNQSPVCTFFRRFKEKHYPKDGQLNDVDSLLVNKIKYNIGKQNEGTFLMDWTIERTLTGDICINDTPARLRREIKSSWHQSHRD